METGASLDVRRFQYMREDGVESDQTVLSDQDVHWYYIYITQNMPVQIYRKFHLQKLNIFR